MHLFRNILSMGIGLVGSAAQADYQFLDWSQLMSTDHSVAEVVVSDLLLRDDMVSVCQMSPYTFSLHPQDSSIQASLESEGLLPVGESGYLFAYFGNQNRLIGSEIIPANKSTLRAKSTYTTDYICVSTTDGRVQISHSEGFISIGLKQAE